MLTHQRHVWLGQTTSQTQEDAQYVFRQTQQNGCLAVYHAVDRAMTHDTRAEALVCMSDDPSELLSFMLTPRG